MSRQNLLYPHLSFCQSAPHHPKLYTDLPTSGRMSISDVERFAKLSQNALTYLVAPHALPLSGFLYFPQRFEVCSHPNQVGS